VSNYCHILNKPPVIATNYRERQEICASCGAEFTKRAGNQVRCKSCAEARAAKLAKSALQRSRAKKSLSK